MSWVIVPNHVADAIYAKVDAELEKHPDLKPERENIYAQLLDHFDRTGQVPDFSLERK